MISFSSSSERPSFTSMSLTASVSWTNLGVEMEAVLDDVDDVHVTGAGVTKILDRDGEEI